MPSDGNAVFLDNGRPWCAKSVLQAETHALIDRLPDRILTAMLPVLQKYAARESLHVHIAGNNGDQTATDHPLG